ncbi:hypothetical protein C8R45DRAFT_453205 [Mycena sanguinolenta]|nr:hypothetical protein C8R45DRAFT_453205 [Mycena sanguinolenta]
MSSTISSSVSPSSPAPTPVTQVNVVADKDAQLAVSTPALPSPKDVRAFEHDRHRVKKAEDLVKRRARKGQGRWAALAKGELYNSSRKTVGPVLSEKQKRLRVDEVDALDGLVADSWREGDGIASCGALTPSEVKLADLITFRKPRKALDGEFVLVPRTPTVIVLDDITSRDFSVDEPWDLLDDEDSPTTKAKAKALSYAEILTAHAK